MLKTGKNITSGPASTVADKISSLRWEVSLKITAEEVSKICDAMSEYVRNQPYSMKYYVPYNHVCNKNNLKVYDFVLKSRGFKKCIFRPVFYKKNKIYYYYTTQGIIFIFKSFRIKVRRSNSKKKTKQK